MQDFSNYSYVIPIEKLEETARNVIKNGMEFTVIINGEYYLVDLDGSKQKEWEMYRKGR